MTQDQINNAIYTSFYQVIRVGIPMSQVDFFAATIANTWPNTPPPTLWPTFWYDSVALEIQQAFISKGKFLPGLDGDWLNKNNAKKWSDLASWANGESSAIGGGLINYSDATK